MLSAVSKEERRFVAPVSKACDQEVGPRLNESCAAAVERLAAEQEP